MESPSFRLPNELLLIIFSQLKVSDLLTCTLVCKAWINLISSDQVLCGKLTLKLTAKNISEIGQHFLFTRPYVSLTFHKINNLSKLFPWKNLHRVQHLVVDNCEFHWDLEVTTLLIKSLEQLSTLKLCIGSNCRLESCLEQLNLLHKLTSLKIVLKPNYKRDFPLNLNALQGLEDFSLGYETDHETPYLTQTRSNALKILPGEDVLHKLKYFRIARLRVKANTLNRIFYRLPNLEHLELVNSCKGADWAALAKQEVLEESISNLKNLRFLTVDDVVVEHDDFLGTMTLPCLENIHLISAENMLLSEFRHYIARTVKIYLIRMKCPNARIAQAAEEHR